MKRRHITPFGTHLLRILAGREQAWLARQSGLSQSTISAWVSGRMQPSGKNIERVAKALNVPYSELWHGPALVPTNGQIPPVQTRGEAVDTLAAKVNHLTEAEAAYLLRQLEARRARTPRRRG